ncbi:MAG: hypothetical protein ORN98_02970 [Alphaproteobacteria bacterium]|nr:hypothetical protein [Alphaproteobacteria bacterium]
MANNQNKSRLPNRSVNSGFRRYIDRLFFDQRVSPNGFLIRAPKKKNFRSPKGGANFISPRVVAANIGVLGFALLAIGIIGVVSGEKDGYLLVVLGGAICVGTFGVMAMQIAGYNRIGRR